MADSSNTALTSQIAASSDRAYGPRYGANVVFPKQLLIDAVLSAATHGRVTQTTDRTAMQSELREHSPDRPAESSDILLQRILGSWRHTLITPRQINEYWPTFGE